MISKAESEAQELITEHDDLVHCKSYLSAPLYKYHFASQCFDIDSIVDDMDSKFFKVLFSSPLSAFSTPSSQNQSVWAPL